MAKWTELSTWERCVQRRKSSNPSQVRNSHYICRVLRKGLIEECSSQHHCIVPPDPTESALMLPSLIHHVGQLFDKSMSSCSTANADVLAAVETVLLSQLHERVFAIVAMAFGEEDSRVNRRAKNLEVEVADSHTSLEDAIGVDERLRPSLQEAGDELSTLPRLKSPMEKTRCFQAAIGRVSGSEGSTSSLSSDEILPAVIFLILRTRGVLHWTAHVNYASSFVFSSCRSQLNRNEFGYILATMEAALEHIKTGVTLSPRTSPSEDDNGLLHCARNGDCEGVIKELEKCGENEATFHHPLCACQTCTSSPTPRTTPLHVASIHGHPLVVDALLSWRRQRVQGKLPTMYKAWQNSIPRLRDPALSAKHVHTSVESNFCRTLYILYHNIHRRQRYWSHCRHGDAGPRWDDGAPPRGTPRTPEHTLTPSPCRGEHQRCHCQRRYSAASGMSIVL